MLFCRTECLTNSCLQKITSEDLSREYTESDKRKLCLRTKVRVNMTLFNCVWDAKQRLEKKGRLVNRSERFINAMLVKAVAKKMVFPYSDESIRKYNHIKQCQLKKDNNHRLYRWSLESTEDCMLDHSHPSPSLLLAQIPNPTLPNNEQHSLELPFKDTATQNSESPLENLANGPEMWTIDRSSGAENESTTENVQSLNLQELGPHTDWAEAAAQINTESMTIGTLEFDLQMQPTESQPILQTEDYDNFNTQVPATSTQTQPQSECTEPFL